MKQHVANGITETDDKNMYVVLALVAVSMLFQSSNIRYCYVTVAFQSSGIRMRACSFTLYFWPILMNHHLHLPNENKQMKPLSNRNLPKKTQQQIISPVFLTTEAAMILFVWYFRSFV